MPPRLIADSNSNESVLRIRQGNQVLERDDVCFLGSSQFKLNSIEKLLGLTLPTKYMAGDQHLPLATTSRPPLYMCQKLL